MSHTRISALWNALDTKLVVEAFYIMSSMLQPPSKWHRNIPVKPRSRYRRHYDMEISPSTQRRNISVGTTSKYNVDTASKFPLQDNIETPLSIRHWNIPVNVTSRDHLRCGVEISISGWHRNPTINTNRNSTSVTTTVFPSRSLWSGIVHIVYDIYTISKIIPSLRLHRSFVISQCEYIASAWAYGANMYLIPWRHSVHILCPRLHFYPTRSIRR